MIKKTKIFFSISGKILLLNILTAVALSAFSQSGKAKVSQQNNSSKDTAIIDAYLKIVFAYSQSIGTHDSANFYLNKIDSLSTLTHYSKGKTEYYRMKAVMYYLLEKEDSLKYAVNRAFFTADSARNKKEQALVNDLLGWINQNREQNDSAADYYIKAAHIADSIKDYNFSGKIYNNLSVVFWNIGNYKKAVEYAKNGFEKAKNLNDTFLLSNALFNLGNAKSRLKQYDTAFILFKRVRELVNDPLKYNQVLFRTISNEAAIYAETGNSKKTILVYEDLLKRYESLPAYLLSYIYSGLGNAQYEENQLGQAETNMQKAINMAIEGGVKLGLRDSYLIMSKIKEKQKEFAPALEYLKKYQSLNDTLTGESRTKYIQQLEAKYNSTKKNSRITEQQLAISENQKTIQKKNILNAALVCGLILLLIIGLLLYRNFMHRSRLLKEREKLKEKKIIELEQERKLVALESVMKGQEEERSRLARDLHDGVGGLLSGVKLSMSNMKGNVFLSEENAQSFNNVILQLDQSIAELRRVSHNMMPEALIKYGLIEALENYCENINLSGKIMVRLQTYGMEQRMDQSTEIVIYRMIQELLNNVIKHADAKNVLIQLVRKDDRFNLTVEDDGKGFDAKEIENKTGAGLSNIKARAEYLNGSVDIVSKKGEGTSVNIEGSCI
jgi:two-component system, NarL family, sensor kinase